jgi:hypothetical protein
MNCAKHGHSQCEGSEYTDSPQTGRQKAVELVVFPVAEAASIPIGFFCGNAFLPRRIGIDLREDTTNRR